MHTGFDHARIDALDIEALTAIGSDKWSRFPGCIGGFIAEMDFGIAAPVRDAIVRTADTGNLGYLPVALEHELSAACAAWQLDTYGWPVPASRVRPVPDVIEALQIVLQHFHPADAAVVVPTPAYMPFLVVPALQGLEIVEVPMLTDVAGWSLDLDAIDDALRAGARTVILCNPHNPIGKVYRRDELIALSRVVDRYGARVFSDEIHAPIVFGDVRHVPYASVSELAASHTITATSASKAFNTAGLKCAQVILSNDLDAARWARIGTWYEHKTASLGALASVTAYRQGRPWLDQVLGYLEGNLDELGALLGDLLPDVRYVRPQGTYIAWLDCTRMLDGGDTAALAARLRTVGVALTDGTECGAAGAGHLRFNVALPRPLLTEAVRRMASAPRRATAPRRTTEGLRA